MLEFRGLGFGSGVPYFNVLVPAPQRNHHVYTLFSLVTSKSGWWFRL